MRCVVYALVWRMRAFKFLARIHFLRQNELMLEFKSTRRRMKEETKKWIAVFVIVGCVDGDIAMAAMPTKNMTRRSTRKNVKNERNPKKMAMPVQLKCYLLSNTAMHIRLVAWLSLLLSLVGQWLWRDDDISHLFHIIIFRLVFCLHGCIAHHAFVCFLSPDKYQRPNAPQDNSAPWHSIEVFTEIWINHIFLSSVVRSPLLRVVNQSVRAEFGCIRCSWSCRVAEIVHCCISSYFIFHCFGAVLYPWTNHLIPKRIFRSVSFGERMKL